MSVQDFLKFRKDDIEREAAEWPCNDGPTALAFALGASLEQVREACSVAGLRKHQRRREELMNMNMMCKAINALDVEYRASESTWPERGLVQWMICGPWKFHAFHHGHKDAHYYRRWAGVNGDYMFDLLGGLRLKKNWQDIVIPQHFARTSRSTGQHYFTNLIEFDL